MAHLKVFLAEPCQSIKTASDAPLWCPANAPPATARAILVSGPNVWAISTPPRPLRNPPHQGAGAAFRGLSRFPISIPHLPVLICVLRIRNSLLFFDPSPARIDA